MRTSTDLIDRMARERFIEDTISSMRCSIGQRKDNLEDLAQDIYMELLERDAETLPDTYDELRYFIVRIILNNINSKTSRYYARYRKAELERIDGNVQTERGLVQYGGSEDPFAEGGNFFGSDGDRAEDNTSLRGVAEPAQAREAHGAFRCDGEQDNKGDKREDI